VTRALALLYHAYLYVFGFECAFVNMGDGVRFVLPYRYREVARMVERGMQTNTWVEVRRLNRRGSRLVLNPHQVCVIGPVRR
jgi:hypothetical protein